MIRRYVFAGALAVALTGTTFAQEDIANDGVYVRVGAGAAFVSDMEQAFTYNPATVFAATPPTNQRLAVGEALTFAGALGFDYADGIRTELEYRFANTDIDSVSTSGGAAPSATVASADQLQAHLVMANFYFDFSNDSKLTPFIGGGVGGAFVTNENGNTDAALAYQGRAGVSLDMGGGVSVSAEYVYTRSRDLVYGPTDEQFAAGDPRPSRLDGANYASSSAMLSIRKRF